jgi:hypothetical protein
MMTMMRSMIMKGMSATMLGWLLCGCVASSDYYTGRTLEEGKFSIGAGADDVAVKSSDSEVSVSKNKPFAPWFGVAYGLPLRLEVGARYFPVNFLELSLRDQVNPRTFDFVDFSLNLHYAVQFVGYSYLKYGVTLSKNISEFEPYVHYSAYHFMGSTSLVFDDSFLSGVAGHFIDDNRSMGIGIALPVQGTKIFPEVNYQYFGGDIKYGLWHFGIGIRVYPNQHSESP